MCPSNAERCGISGLRLAGSGKPGAGQCTRRQCPVFDGRCGVFVAPAFAGDADCSRCGPQERVGRCGYRGGEDVEVVVSQMRLFVREEQRDALRWECPQHGGRYKSSLGAVSVLVVMVALSFGIETTFRHVTGKPALA
jgi:hypothetical protein